MSEHCAGAVDEFGPGIRKILHVGETEVVVLRVGENFHAFENRCPHMGGPVGEGLVIGRVRARLDEHRRLVHESLCETEPQLVCPWHGWAYDVRTGVFAGDPRHALRRFPTRTEDDRVYVTV